MGADRLQTLSRGSGQTVRALDWSDDQLGIVLDELGDPAQWQAFEQDLNRHTLRVYRLKPSQVRVDSTTASGHWTVTDDGLFQFWHSKDQRPDLPQLKVTRSVSALDPLGLLLVTQVVSGERADDGLYRPGIQQVRASLAEPGLLYIGDCKLAALATRAVIQPAATSTCARCRKNRCPWPPWKVIRSRSGPGSRRPRPSSAPRPTAHRRRSRNVMNVRWS